MNDTIRPPGLTLRMILVCGFALSIGWGIRGNFGHEYGAGFAGCLAVMAACIMSGREDWRRRLPYFAFFGALGWGFGGSISYMQVISYTHSGHGPSVLYGFIALFWIGFLWAAMGVAAAALPAVADRERLTALFPPLLCVFGAWLIMKPVYDWLETALATAAAEGRDGVWHRHKSPLYWFDSDYFQAFFALIGVCAFDIWNRRTRDVLLLPVFIAGGAGLGWLAQYGLHASGTDVALAEALTWSLGDPAAIDPQTGEAFGAENLLNNWPQWFSDFPQHIGWVVGIIGGAKLYFLRFGKFRCGSSLFVYLAGGWIAGFFWITVLGSLFFTEIGGLRMTPPRSDDWSGITGLFLGATLWLMRNRLTAVSFASMIGGAIGGVGFAGSAWAKLMCLSNGNEAVLKAKVAEGLLDATVAAAEIERWSHWQHQNWHSFLEQSYGFVNGIAVAVALGFLARRAPWQPDPNPPRRWTLGVAAFFTLVGVTYVNLVKNVSDWSGLNPSVWKGTDGEGAKWDIPYLGRWPDMDQAWTQLSPAAWFNLTYALIAVAFIILVRSHLRRPIAAVPRSALGRGQIMFLTLTWAMVIGNWERAIPGWHPSRLLTEWGIFANALAATVMILVWPRESQGAGEPRLAVARVWWPRWIVATLIGAMFAAGSVGLMFRKTREVYGDYHAGHSARQMRLGPDATWKTAPILKNRKHS